MGTRRDDGTPTGLTRGRHRDWRAVAALIAVVIGGTGLISAGAKAGTLDQSQEGANDVAPPIFGLVRQAQTFTAGITGGLDQVDLFLQAHQAHSFDPTGLLVEIRTVAGNVPSAVVLGSATIPASDVPPSGFPAFVDALFTTPVAVVAGTQYAIVASATDGFPKETSWIRTNGNPYAGGSPFFKNGGDPWTAHSSGDFKFRTYVAPAANLALSKTDSPDPATVGQNLVYTLVVSNGGAADAEDVEIVDTLPASVTFGSASAGCTNASGTVTCALGTVPSGTSRTVQITVRPTQTGTITNTATVSASSSTFDPQTSNNTANEPTAVGAASAGPAPGGPPAVAPPGPGVAPPPGPGPDGDTTAPTTTITSAPIDKTRDRTPTFAFTSSELGARFECSVDGSDFAACTSQHTTPKLDRGRHTFQVRAIDAAGNTDLSPASETFTIKRKRKR